MRKMGLNRDYVIGIYDDPNFTGHIGKHEKV